MPVFLLSVAKARAKLSMLVASKYSATGPRGWRVPCIVSYTEIDVYNQLRTADQEG